MIGLIDVNGNYYEADENITGATEVPKRPSASHLWLDGAWVIDAQIALTTAKSNKRAELDAAYSVAIQVSVSYMGHLFQADDDSQNILTKTLSVLTPLGATPPGFFWKAEDNTHVPMTLAQLQGLAQAMFAQGWAAFQNRDTKKATVTAAATAEAVNAVGW